MEVERNSFQYRILADHNLIVKYYTSQPSFEKIFEYVVLAAKDPDFLTTMNVLHDIRNCSFHIDEKAMHLLVEKIKESAELYGQRRAVFLTETPNQVVFGTILRLVKNENLIDISISSTLDRALNYLGIPKKDYKLVKETLHELEMKCENSVPASHNP